MEQWKQEQVAYECFSALKRLGIDVHIERDMAKARSTMELLEKPYFSRTLDAKHIAFTHTNAFWIFAIQDDEPLMGAGVRLDDLGGETFRSYFLRTSIATYGEPAIECEDGFEYPELCGRIVYFGDLHVRPGSSLSSRRLLILKLFSYYCQHRSFTDFAADATYCFMRETDHDRRAASSYGFLQSSPFIWTWERSPFLGGIPEWMGITERAQMPKLTYGIRRLLRNKFAIN